MEENNKLEEDSSVQESEQSEKESKRLIHWLFWYPILGSWISGLLGIFALFSLPILFIAATITNVKYSKHFAKENIGYSILLYLLISVTQFILAATGCTFGFALVTNQL